MQNLVHSRLMGQIFRDFIAILNLFHVKNYHIAICGRILENQPVSGKIIFCVMCGNSHSSAETLIEKDECLTRRKIIKLSSNLDGCFFARRKITKQKFCFSH